jgi:hypothetical protein
VYVYENSGTTEVVTEHDPTGTTYGPCTDDGGERTVVDVTGGTVGGESCSALSFISDLEQPNAITYHDTETAGSPTGNGTYHLFVDNATVADPPEPQFNDGPGDSPWADAAAYAVGFDAVYGTEQLRYEARIRIAPGEPDE